MHLRVSDVYGGNVASAALEQTVGKTARRSAHVQTIETGRIKSDIVECRRKFFAAPGNEGTSPTLQSNHRFVAYPNAGLVSDHIVHEHAAR